MLALRHLRLRLLVVALYALTLAFVGLMQPLMAGAADDAQIYAASLPGGIDVTICSHGDDATQPGPAGPASHLCHGLCLVCCIAGLGAVAEWVVPPPDGLPTAVAARPEIATVDLWRAQTKARGPPAQHGLA